MIIFSYIYTNKVMDYSKINNTLLTSINQYAQNNNKYCIEGKINEEGVILSFSGKIVDKNKSYSNMKGNIFNKELIEYKKDECILNKENNYDKYIIKGNEIENNISIVIDITNEKYYKDMINIFNKKNMEYNLLVNDNYNDEYVDNILYKGNNIKQFKNNYKNIYCVEINNKLLEQCKSYKINTIRPINYINDSLYINIKKILNKGDIYFIKESIKNINELEITLNYIKSRNYNIVSINELLS